MSKTTKGMNEYEKAIDEGKLPVSRGIKLTEDDVLRNHVIMELMSNFSLNIKRVEKEFDIDFKEYFKDALSELEEFVKEELVMIDENSIKVSPTGAMLIRNISMPFDAYLKKIPEEKRRFSKTV